MIKIKMTAGKQKIYTKNVTMFTEVRTETLYPDLCYEACFQSARVDAKATEMILVKKL